MDSGFILHTKKLRSKTQKKSKDGRKKWEGASALWEGPGLLSSTLRLPQELFSRGFHPEFLLPWVLHVAGFLAASWAEQIGTQFHIFLPLKVLCFLLAIICCFQTGFVKPWYTGESLVEQPQKLLTWLQSITLTKQDFFFFPFAQPTSRVSAQSLHVCGREIQTLLHYSLAWIWKVFPYVFYNVCVHITNWTFKSDALNF